MAILLTETRWVENPNRQNLGDWEHSFNVDDPADISSLPIIGEVFEGKTVASASAFIVSTKKAAFLGSNGWVQ